MISMLIAVHDVKERLLVAGMVSLEGVEDSQVGEASEQLKSLKVFEETVAATVGSSSSGSLLSASTEDSRVPVKGKGKATSSDDGEGDEEKQYSKKELLMMKVEGMVDVLLADLVNFTMPDEFY